MCVCLLCVKINPNTESIVATDFILCPPLGTGCDDVTANMYNGCHTEDYMPDRQDYT